MRNIIMRVKRNICLSFIKLASHPSSAHVSVGFAFFSVYQTFPAALFANPSPLLVWVKGCGWCISTFATIGSR